jgi:hypothetical protein
VSARTVLVPDLGDDLSVALVAVEELLLTYAIWESAGEVEFGELPAPLVGGVALAALRRIWDAVVPTLGRVLQNALWDVEDGKTTLEPAQVAIADAIRGGRRRTM